MTKKDYLLIADVIRTEAERWNASSLQARVISELQHSMSEALAKENTRFNADMFFDACARLTE